MRSYVLMAISIKIMVFWEVTPCSLVDGYQYFAGISCVHLQGRTVIYGLLIYPVPIVSLLAPIFILVAPCSLVECYQRFEGICCLHLQCRRVRLRVYGVHQSLWFGLSHSYIPLHHYPCFPRGSVFCPEGGGRRVFRSI